MSTTQLFVELIVIGFGVIIWGSLLIAGAIEWSFNTCILDSIKSLWPGILGLAYVFGILLDRIMFKAFDRKTKKIIKKILGDEKLSDVSSIERLVMEESGPLNFLIDYNRTRSRICRAWFINFLFIGVCFLFWQYRINIEFKSEHLFTFVALIIMSTISYWLGNKLEEDQYNHIKYSHEYIITKKRKNGNYSSD